MGRAIVTDGGPDGLYYVSRDFGSDRAAALLAAINARIDALDPQIDAARAAYEAKQAGEAALEAALTAANDAFVAAYTEACTPEGWDADPVQDEYDALRQNLAEIAAARDDLDAAVRAQAEAAIEREQLQLDEPALKAEAEAAEANLEAAQKAAQDAMEDYQEAIVKLSARQEACVIQQDFAFDCYADEYYAAEKARLDWQYAQYTVLPAAEEWANQASAVYLDLLAQIAAAEAAEAAAEADEAEAQERLDKLIEASAALRESARRAAGVQPGELQSGA